MQKMSRITLLALCIALPVAAQAASAPTAPRKTLHAFASEAEISALFQKWSEERKRRDDEARQRRAEQLGALEAQTQSMTPPPAAPKAEAKAALSSAIGVRGTEDSVTNVQHAGVDEGGIVK